MEHIKDLDLSTWGDFWKTFRLPILVSLLGALIGHYSKNGVIQLPLFVIPYERGEWVRKIAESKLWKPIRWILTIIFTVIDFIRFILGIRWDAEQAGKGTYIDLGLLGDILIGVGTGVLAKTAIELADTENIYAEVSAAFIAGFAGLSYIRNRQNEQLGIDKTNETDDKVVDPSEDANPTISPDHPENKTTTSN